MSEAKRESKGPVRGFFFDKSVVVTGASSGIGHDVALAFGEQGAQVALIARRRVQLEELARKINKAGGKALALDCDVTDRARVFWAIEQVKEAFGKVDILINSAGLLIAETPLSESCLSALRAIGVSITPGITSETFIPVLNSSIRSASVIPTKANLVEL